MSTTKLKTVTLSNSFHRTEVNVRVPEHCLENGRGAWGWIQCEAMDAFDSSHPAHRRLRRVEKALCGIEDCKCGTVR